MIPTNDKFCYRNVNRSQQIFLQDLEIRTVANAARNFSREIIASHVTENIDQRLNYMPNKMH